MKKFFISLLITAVLLGTSCSQKKWKETTHVDFYFHLAKSTIPYIEFDSGTMTINELDFYGDRQKGGEVEFKNPMPNSTLLDFGTGKTNPPVYYDIPQGTYARISLTLKSDSLNHSNPRNIYLIGRFKKLDNDVVDLVIKINTSLIYGFNATTSSGNSTIVLVKDTPATCDITFDANHWFDGISQADLDSACDSHDLDISSATDENPVICKRIIANINQSTTAVFH